MIDFPAQQIIEIEFTAKEGGRWLKAEVSAVEYTDILNTGTLDGSPICAIKNTVCTSELGTTNIIYDFVLAKRGLPAWRYVDVAAD